jgi:peptide/nickel transport system substrate-binding protein
MKRWKKLGVFASFAILAMMLTAVLVVAACGGDDEDEAEPTAAAVIETPPAPATVVAVSTPVPATAVPEVMVMEGTIPGSVLTIGLETVGVLTTEPRSDLPLYGCRPGCLIMKDDIFVMDRVGNIQPHVVKEWDFGADTRSWTIKMQEGIKFFNGREANINDLEFSLWEGYGTRPCGIPSPYCSEARDPKGGFAFYNHPYFYSTHEIVDDETIKIEFENPTVGLAQMTLTTNLDPRGLYSEQEVKAVGWEEWLKDPILSGSYKKLKDVPGERKEFEVHVDWWKEPAPDFEKQVHLQVPEAATRLAMLASKQADIITLSALTLNQALQLDHVKILQQPATVHLQFYFYNMLHQDDQGFDTDNPFTDPRVREAFAIAIDRQALVDTIYAGKSEVQNAPMMATGMRGWDHPLVVEMRNNPIPFDPDRAKELLAEANFPMDRTVRILAGVWAPSGAPEKKEVTEAVHTMLLDNLGLNIELVQSGSAGEYHKPQRYDEDKPAIDWDISAGGRNSTEPVITTRASYLHRRNVAYFLTDPHWSKMKEIDNVLLTTSDLAEFDEASAMMSKYVRDNYIMIPLVTNPLFWGVVKDRVADWPLTVGAPWPHYFEYIEAADGAR